MTSVLSPFSPHQAEQPAPQPSWETVTVTPELAAEWMARNHCNRPVRYPKVAQMARDMANGAWQVNGEALKFAGDGTLLDGQHRLSACIMAGVPFQTFVVKGLPSAAQQTMDTGMRRSVSDQLVLQGKKHAVVLASLARWHLAWQRGARGKGSSSADPTYPEILEFLAVSGPWLEEAAEFAVWARDGFRMVRTSVWGMSWLLFTAINEQQAREFLGQVRDGASLDRGHPAYTLRERIIRSRTQNERLTEWELIALFCTAWNHFRAGNQLARLHLPKGGLTPKNFPMPK